MRLPVHLQRAMAAEAEAAREARAKVRSAGEREPKKGGGREGGIGWVGCLEISPFKKGSSVILTALKWGSFEQF